MHASALPQPQRQVEFYDGVPVKRLIAWGIDMIITAVLAAPLILPTVGISVFLIFPILLVPLFFTLVGFLYRWAFLSMGSATIGMRIMSIELRDHEGLKISGTTAFLHTLGSTLSFGMPLIQIASMALMATTQRGQGLTDMVLGTTMLNKSAR